MPAAASSLVSLLAVCALVGACEKTTVRSSEAVDAPTGRWRRAHVEVERGPRFSKNGRWYPPHVAHRLLLDWDRPYNRAQSTLLHETTESLSPPDFEALRETSYTLRFAPDAHALALSADGARSWALFDLTPLTSPTGQPFWCAHRVFTSLDPWPSSRALALEVLAATDPDSAAARVHRAPDATLWPMARGPRSRAIAWMTDLDGAIRYACAHRDDGALREALAAALARSAEAREARAHVRGVCDG
jgi:hypothetical protein